MANLTPLRIEVRTRCEGFYLRWYYNGWHYWHWLAGKREYITEGENYRTTGKRQVTLNSGPVTQQQVDGLRTIANSREVGLYTDAGWGVVRLLNSTLKVFDLLFGGYALEITVVISSRQPSFTGLSPIVIPPDVDPPIIEQCELVIGSQVWACYNYDLAYPASRVYNDGDQASAAVWGRLYNFGQVMANGFTPLNWEVPTLADYEELFDYLDIVGSEGALKTTDPAYPWDAPNTGADDAGGFKIVPSGIYFSYVGGYMNRGVVTPLWSRDGLISFGNDRANVIVLPWTMFQPDANYFTAVRLIKKSTFVQALFGLLYNGITAQDERNIANIGWHAMTEPEAANLDNRVGTQASQLREQNRDWATYWNVNSGNNAVGFNGRGAGWRWEDMQNNSTFFGGLLDQLIFWLDRRVQNAGQAYAYTKGENTPDILTIADSDTTLHGCSLRLVRDRTPLNEGQQGQYIGNDGKKYRTKVIAGMEVLADNLCETKLRLTYWGVHGRLYNYYAIEDERGLAAAGWHVAGVDDWNSLRETCQTFGDAWNNDAGAVLKDGDPHVWLEGTLGDNSRSWNGRGGGALFVMTYSYEPYHVALFADRWAAVYYWVGDVSSADAAAMAWMSYDALTLGTPYDENNWDANNKRMGANVRLVKDSTALQEGEFGIYHCNDGQLMETVSIGGREWLCYNLIETKFRNGQLIPRSTDLLEWAEPNGGALQCTYEGWETNDIPEAITDEQWLGEGGTPVLCAYDNNWAYAIGLTPPQIPN